MFNNFLCIAIITLCNHLKVIGQNNYQIKSFSYNMDNSFEAKDTILSGIQYFTADSILEKEIRFFNNHLAKSKDIIIISYNKQCQVLQRIAYIKDSTYIKKTFFTRDSLGNLLEQLMVDNNDTTLLVHTNKYDAKNNLIETSFAINNNKNYQAKVINVFNENNKIIHSKSYINTVLNAETINSYDAKNNQTSCIIKNVQDKNITKVLYSYNYNNQKIRQEDFIDDELMSTKEFDYDGENLILEKTIDAKLNIATITYFEIADF